MNDSCVNQKYNYQLLFHPHDRLFLVKVHVHWAAGFYSRVNREIKVSICYWLVPIEENSKWMRMSMRLIINHCPLREKKLVNLVSIHMYACLIEKWRFFFGLRLSKRLYTKQNSLWKNKNSRTINYDRHKPCLFNIQSMKDDEE